MRRVAYYVVWDYDVLFTRDDGPSRGGCDYFLHDYFDIELGKSKAGDSRNADALIALSKNSEERISFQEDFRNIALSVGSKLASGRLMEVSATSMRDAARGVEDEMSGVNLDEEASRLLEQQQAYKAAAQILQASRQMFETLVSIM